MNASDQRSLALHAEVARAIASDPSIVERARMRVAGWLEDPSRVTDLVYAEAWQELLSRHPTEICERLVESSERMQTLRSCSPFTFVLSPRRRWQLLRELRDA